MSTLTTRLIGEAGRAGHDIELGPVVDATQLQYLKALDERHILAYRRDIYVPQVEAQVNGNGEHADCAVESALESGHNIGPNGANAVPQEETTQATVTALRRCWKYIGSWAPTPPLPPDVVAKWCEFAPTNSWILPKSDSWGTLWVLICNLNAFTQISLTLTILSCGVLFIKLGLSEQIHFNWDWEVVFSLIMLILQILCEIVFEAAFYDVLMDTNIATRVLWNFDYGLAWFVFLTPVAGFLVMNWSENQRTMHGGFMAGQTVSSFAWLLLALSVLIHLDHNLRMDQIIVNIFKPMLDTLKNKSFHRRAVDGTAVQRTYQTEGGDRENIVAIMHTNSNKLERLKQLFCCKLVVILLCCGVSFITTFAYVFFSPGASHGFLLFVNYSSIALQLSSAWLVVTYNSLQLGIELRLKKEFDYVAGLWGFAPTQTLFFGVIVSGLLQLVSLVVSQSIASSCTNK